MDMFKDKSCVMRRVSDEDKECLDAFLNHAFATSAIDNTIAWPCGLCYNRFYYDMDTVRDYLFIKRRMLFIIKIFGFCKGRKALAIMIVIMKAMDESFEQDMHVMINQAFKHHEPSNCSSGLNKEAMVFLKLIEDAGLTP